MKVTPLDLRQQKFKTVMRATIGPKGSFLAKRQTTTRRRCARRTASATTSPRAVQPREHREGERNLRNTLLTAQKLADEIRLNADSEGKRLVRDARAAPTCCCRKRSRASRKCSANRRPPAEVGATWRARSRDHRALRNALEFVREQTSREREDKILPPSGRGRSRLLPLPCCASWTS